jgi:hypothetical protein
MRKIVFYSWQSDSLNATNRAFIQDALEKAAAKIASDNSIAVEPVVDRDTKGVAGAPDIAATIFAKISAADIFVADISIIGVLPNGRATPNPNVMIELGFALKSLGYERVVLVFNEASGKIQDLPFDLRMRRLTVYDLAKGGDKPAQRKVLEGHFDAALRAALGQIPIVADATPILASLAAIEDAKANRILVLRRDLSAILHTLTSLEPKKHSEGSSADDLLAAWDKTQEPIAEFSKIVKTIAAMNDLEAALEVHRWFGGLFLRFDNPDGFSGRFSEADHDFFKVVGHEMFTTAIAALIAERRWEVIGRVLDEPIPVSYVRTTGGPGVVSWDYASQHSLLLIEESRKRSRISLHGDILKVRHTTGGLATILPFEELVAADLFLFLKGELPPEKNRGGFFVWRPWACLGLKSAPVFVREAERLQYAERISKAIGTPSVDEFKKRFLERGYNLNRLFSSGFWDWPLEKSDIDKIGTRS